MKTAYAEQMCMNLTARSMIYCPLQIYMKHKNSHSTSGAFTVPTELFPKISLNLVVCLGFMKHINSAPNVSGGY